jgi:hypothetical protein
MGYVLDGYMNGWIYVVISPTKTPQTMESIKRWKKKNQLKFVLYKN